ncbi:hypothetical protein [Halalkalibacter hemicellulosilyticus]|nr:hypothetical protein [Halalkalibacter hemicellulosilyticus]
MDEIEDEVYSTKLEKEINHILHNRYAFVISVSSHIEKLNSIKEMLEKGMGINKNQLQASLKIASLKYPNEMKQLKDVINPVDELYKAKDLMNEFYQMEMKKLYPSLDPQQFTLEEKEILIVGTDYYKRTITLDTIDDLRRYSIEEQIHLTHLLTDYTDSNKYSTLKQQYPD